MPSMERKKGSTHWIHPMRNTQRETSSTTMGGMVLPVPRTVPAKPCRMLSSQ